MLWDLVEKELCYAKKAAHWIVYCDDSERRSVCLSEEEEEEEVTLLALLS